MMNSKKRAGAAGCSGRRRQQQVSVQWSKPTTFKVPIPRDEPERLAELRAYRILDTPPETAFDQITALAAQICDAPIALLSLVDADRQWFKSKVGSLPAQTPREVAFCAHAIMGRDLFLVRDAVKDQRFAHNPLVTARPGIRFYAGMPLASPRDHALGALCVMDRVPRALTAQQARALRALGRLTMALLNSRRRIAELENRLRL